MTDNVNSPGALLRQARQAQGIELDTLAAMTKVAPAKLEALESDQYDRLPDPSFTRALAMTICRSLKIDGAAILAGLPTVSTSPLSVGLAPLNQPFKESRGVRLSFETGQRSFQWRALLRPQWLAPLALLLAAAVVYVLPDNFVLPSWGTDQAAQPVAAPEGAGVTPLPAEAEGAELEAPQADGSAPPLPTTPGLSAAPSAGGEVTEVLPPVTLPVSPAPAAELPSSLPSVMTAPAAAAKPVASESTGAGDLTLRSSELSWVEVHDATGRRLLGRQVQAGEVVNLSGAAPLRVLLGNAPGMQVSYQGKAFDAAPFTRSKVARFELK